LPSSKSAIDEKKTAHQYLIQPINIYFVLSLFYFLDCRIWGKWRISKKPKILWEKSFSVLHWGKMTISILDGLAYQYCDKNLMTHAYLEIGYTFNHLKWNLSNCVGCIPILFQWEKSIPTPISIYPWHRDSADKENWIFQRFIPARNARF